MPSACRARRGADPAALGVAQERARAAGAGQAHVHGHVGGASGEVDAVFDDAVGRERELGEDIGAEALAPRERQFLRQRGGQGGRGDAWMALGVAGQSDLAHPARAEQAIAQQSSTFGVTAERLRHIAADQQHLAHAGLLHGSLQERLGLRPRGDAAHGDVRHRLQARLVERDQRRQGVGERPSGQMVDIDRRAGGQQLGNAAGVVGRLRAHLQRAAGDKLGGDSGDLRAAACAGGAWRHRPAWGTWGQPLLREIT